jgi:hypothetical protein
MAESHPVIDIKPTPIRSAMRQGGGHIFARFKSIRGLLSPIKYSGYATHNQPLNNLTMLSWLEQKHRQKNGVGLSKAMLTVEQRTSRKHFSVF